MSWWLNDYYSTYCLNVYTTSTSPVNRNFKNREVKLKTSIPPHNLFEIWSCKFTNQIQGYVFKLFLVLFLSLKTQSSLLRSYKYSITLLFPNLIANIIILIYIKLNNSIRHTCYIKKSSCDNKLWMLMKQCTCFRYTTRIKLGTTHKQK